MVKKAVNWALRQIGSVIPTLCAKAIATARRLGNRIPRRTLGGRDALREVRGRRRWADDRFLGSVKLAGCRPHKTMVFPTILRP